MSAKFSGKRKYQKMVLARAVEHKDFIADHLRREWDILEKQARKERLVRAVKQGASTAAMIAGQTLLTLLLASGTLAVAATAPNVLGAIGRIGKRRVYFHKKNFQREIGYLKKEKYVRAKRIRDPDDQDIEITEIALTELGTKRAVMRALGELKMIKPQKWDRIWRVVIFDVPNRHKAARDGLRHRLKTLGFYRLQESIFVYPYPCDEELRFLASLYNIGDYIRIIEAGAIVRDDDLKEYFELK